MRFALIPLLFSYLIHAQTVFPLEPRLPIVRQFVLDKVRIAEPVLRGMRAGERDLYFLVQDRLNKSAPTTLVRTSTSGVVVFTTSLGVVDVIDWSVTPGGEVILALEPLHGGVSELRRYNPTGDIVQSSPLPKGAYLAATADSGAPFAVTRSGQIMTRANGVNGREVNRIPLRHPGIAVHGAAMSENRIAIVDAAAGTITIVDLRTGQFRSKGIDHPEIARVAGTYGGDLGAPIGLTIMATAPSSATQNNIYCMLSGFRPEEGAPIIELDGDGKTVRVFRCPIVKDRDGKPMVPSGIAVTNDELFICDHQGQVVGYQLGGR